MASPIAQAKNNGGRNEVTALASFGTEGAIGLGHLIGKQLSIVFNMGGCKLIKMNITQKVAIKIW